MNDHKTKFALLKGAFSDSGISAFLRYVQQAAYKMGTHASVY